MIKCAPSDEARGNLEAVRTFSKGVDRSAIYLKENGPNDNPIQHGEAAPCFDTDAASQRSKQVDFGTLFARLPEPAGWRWWWAGLFASGKRNTGAVSPEVASKGHWFSRKSASVSSWWKAHISFGLFGKGRGHNFHAVRSALAEKAWFEAQFRLSGGTHPTEATELVPALSEGGQTGVQGFHPEETAVALDDGLPLAGSEPPLTRHIASIHGDMLATLDHIEALHDADPDLLGRRETWLSYSLKGVRRLASYVIPAVLPLFDTFGRYADLLDSAPTRPGQRDASSLRRFLGLQPKELNLLEDLLARSNALARVHGHGEEASTAQVVKKLEGLISKGAVLSLRSYDASALVAQLTMDQSTLERLAALPDNSDGSVVEQILGDRTKSRLQQLRGKGFASMAEIDHVFRSNSYLTHGLSNPKHKLNKILADSAGVGPENVASTYAHLIANLKAGEQITIDAGWGRGFTLQWIVLGLKKAGFFGATTYVGLDQNFDYSLTFKNVNGSIEVGFGRRETKGIDAGASAWVGVGVGHEDVGFYAGGTVGLNLRKQWGAEGSLSLSLGSASPDIQTNLEQLLSGKASDPYEALGMGDVTEVAHFKTEDNSANLSAMPDGLFSHSVNASPNLIARSEGQAFISPLYLRAEAEIIGSNSRQGGKFMTASGAYRTERSHELYSILTHKPKWSLGVGTAALLRGRLGNEIPGTSRATEGRLHGGAATGKIGAGVEKQWERKTWSEYLWGSPKAKFSVPEQQIDLQGDTVDISWTMTLPRKASALRSPSLRMLPKTRRSNLEAAMRDSISFTTPENRKTINGMRKGLSRSLKGDMEELSLEQNFKELEQRADFLTYKDRARFRKALFRIERKLQRNGKPVPEQLQKLKKLTENADDTLWQSKYRSDAIVIDMKASSEDLADFKKLPLDDKAIETGGFGQAQAIRTNEARSKTTSANLWIPFFQYRSSSALTAANLSTWRVASKDFKVQADAP
ncbi:hypothetical protein [Roseibium sp.]|uniref:hypothetical protein n=1 Tax=Roseibium sp. TaxID=1936156 RepID=UPI00329A480E